MLITTPRHHRAAQSNAHALEELRAMLVSRDMPKQYLTRCENRGTASLLVAWQAKNRPRHSARPGQSLHYCTACGETF